MRQEMEQKEQVLHQENLTMRQEMEKIEKAL